MPVTVQVDEGRAVVALGAFRLKIEQNAELMQQLGNAQLVSVRRTFEDEGSPAGSWAPLAPSTIKRNPKIYGPGHKLLVLSSRLLNSIGVFVEPGEAILGTSLVYARVHQLGSRDRSFGIGPRTKEQEEAMVQISERERLHAPYRTRLILGNRPKAAAEGPISKEGGSRPRVRLEGPRKGHYVRERLEGPSSRRIIAGHGRHQNIPARPYLVFRPEDPERLAAVAQAYVLTAAKSAGLEAAAE